MRYGFILGDAVAVLVNHWVEPADGGDEHGARVEVQRVHASPREVRYAFMELTLREPIWRGDLFTWDGGPAGNWERAHHHFSWDSLKPTDRAWDPLLKEDPVAWVERHLGDFAGLLRQGGASDLADQVSPSEVAGALPAIMAAIRTCMSSELAAAARARGVTTA